MSASCALFILDIKLPAARNAPFLGAKTVIFLSESTVPISPAWLKALIAVVRVELTVVDIFSGGKMTRFTTWRTPPANALF